MRNIVAVINPNKDFEYHNSKIRRVMRCKVQQLMEPFVEHQLFTACNIALDQIYCCNDMTYMVVIMQSSRDNKLAYMLECIENRDQRREHRQKERVWGFWHP